VTDGYHDPASLIGLLLLPGRGLEPIDSD
jgi:hypothetical protein